MGFTVEGQVGPRSVSDGGNTELRQARLGGLVVLDGHGRYTEAATRYGWMASTAVAGVAPGTALSTTPPFVLWNPAASGVNLSVLTTSLGYVSGTLGAGTIAYAGLTGNTQNTVPTGGTELTPICANLSAKRPIGRVFQGSTLAATPGILYPSYSLSAFLATTAVQPFTLGKDDVAGAIVIPPGGAFVMQGVAAAGSSPLLMFGCFWEEIPT